jgi:acyl-coenzyme A synthetase/AMP-(fatty) acid ligase
VITETAVHYSVLCEAVVNEHPQVYRSALVGVENEQQKRVPALIVEPTQKKVDETRLLKEVQTLAAANRKTKNIEYFLVHYCFPVDIRHNAKIFREKLAVWAQKQLFPHR